MLYVVASCRDVRSLRLVWERFSHEGHIVLFILQLASVVSVFVATFFIFQSVGLRRDTLFYTRDEKKSFDATISGFFGSFATVTNIVATLTSLATVYVFFLGTSKVFGYWVFICAFSIGLSYLVTNPVTTSLLSRRPRIKKLYSKADQISAVIASLVWSDSSTGNLSSRLVQYISLASIASIIWLEFSIFSDVSGIVLKIDELSIRAGMLFVLSLSVFFFTFKYGLRGFVLAELFQAPLLLIGSVVLLVGISFAVASNTSPSISITALSLTAPLISVGEGIMFTAHVLILNAFLIVVSEAHWLRAWIFGDRETTMQPTGAISTGISWLLLIAMGLLATTLTKHTGNEGVAELLESVHAATSNPLFLCAFWVAATAALFSTADAQLYSLLVVRSFRPSTGALDDNVARPKNTLALSAAFALILSAIYIVVRIFNLPFEKLIFLIIPLNLNILPAFAAMYSKYEPPPLIILCSLFFYGFFGVVGLSQPHQNFFWTLASALVPAVISLVILCPRVGPFVMRLMAAKPIVATIRER